MNPGNPPPPPGYGWMPPTQGYPGYPPMPMRSTTPRTLGTLSMVFGGIVVATSAMSLALGKGLGTMTAQPGQREAMNHYLDRIHSYSMVQATVMLLMSAALFYIGLGQRGYKRWAANASVLWGAVGLVVIVAQFIGAFTVVLPALGDFMGEISHGQIAAEAMSTIIKVSTFIGIAFYAPYPIILMVAFRRPHNVAAMTEPSPELPVAQVR